MDTQDGTQFHHSGWVFIVKEPNTISNWKKRFMAIDNYTISFSTKENKELKESKESNLIHLYAVQNIRAIADYKGKQNVFKIVTPSHIYNISASDNEDRAKWIAAVQAKLPKLTTSGRGRTASVGMNTINNALLSRYQKLKCIGRGGFSTVYLVVKDDTRRHFAMKIIKQGAQKPKNLMQETKILTNVNHPFLIKLHCSFQTDEAIYFIMDFVNGGALYYHLHNAPDGHFSEDRARFYTAQIVCGVEYLHKSGVVYRDLKPENILVSAEGNIVLTDFGLSKSDLYGAEARTATRCGTPQYVAPEVVLGNIYTKTIDWWSLGIVLHEMVTGNSPFYSDDEMEIYQNIVYSEVTIPENSMSTKCASLIQAFLIKDPELRLSDPSKIKKHPFFKGISWKKLQNLQVTPPFIPEVSGPEDTKYIDQKILLLPLESEKSTLVSSYSDFTLAPVDSLESGSQQSEEASEDSENKK